MWFIAVDEVKWGFSSVRIRAMVVDELSHRHVFIPIRRVVSTEDAKIGFYFLIDSFSFTISLSVIGR